ncbi:hypothetical protein Zm00014a_036086 [Zea mays]|jgi:hypothetical protein|uniref:Uncharacterized protein n=2 Tax=Zea mays TaxID=4577 RepID=B4FT83_MAIZE|nr:uncharacterized protein LOC100278646 [Zea mays]ACF85326.1 unknown [Zea mays]ACG24120.1 hypothetical protein [Zea mays]ACG24957.1 hypothetical protein [Zea mays]ACG39488.1 hypothetical protein [Zea mays]ACG46795.1 hypothetical protein [Zea mays]
MEDDAISTLMDIDDSPLSAAGAGFLDEEDGEGEMFFAPHRAARGGAGDARGPLPFSGFFNSFDGADFDDDDLA